MRRSTASLSLAILLAASAFAPVSAVEPSVPSPEATAPTVDPTADLSATPDADPSATPDADPTPDPTTDPTPTPDPTPDPTEAPSPATIPDASVPPSASVGPIVESTTGRPDVTGQYIVVLKAKSDRSALIDRHRQREGMRPMRTFGRAFNGFTAQLDRGQRRALLSDPNVVAVVPDEVIELAAQTVPTGVSRIGARSSSTAAIDGVDQRVDADVAIVDTGIALHPDLNVAGGYNCSTSDRALWRDKEGHGTHVAGTVAALDNDLGVVGVAPGARVWAVKILNDDGYGKLSWYVCGLDWIIAQRDPNDASRPLFEAVNMSVTKWGADDHACGAASDDILHAAICRVVAGGVTVVAAAANDSGSASKRVPAAYNEVITVSALADTDGRPGGLGGNRCYSWGTYDKDDTFASFSNYGGDVDIIAPGKCIWSTIPGGKYAYSSGTSMAAPAVAGAVALYKASRPNATPKDVKEALQFLGNLDWKTSTDPDDKPERLLDVSRIGKLGAFDFASPAATNATAEAGGTAAIPVRIVRSSSFFERVRLSATTLPDGWAASFSPSSVMGWSANQSSLVVDVPDGTKAGTYSIGLTATNQGRTAHETISVTITKDDPTAFAPTVRPLVGVKVAVNTSKVPTAVSMRVEWAEATDPSSQIAGYELERSIDGGAWTTTTATLASTRSLDIANVPLSKSYRFRLRAQDTAGHWSAWKYGAAVRFSSVSDRASAVSYRGTWSRASVSSATNGVRTTSKVAGATARMTFTGRGIAVVMPRSSVRGKASIYINGTKVATVDTYASSAQARRVVWSTMWPTSSTRTIVVRVAGTSGRPTVSLDGFIVTK